MDLFWSLPNLSNLGPNRATTPLAELFANGVRRRYDAGTRLSDPETAPERTFLCTAGTLKVTKLLSSGREILITILQPGSSFSDRAIINGYWREVFIDAIEPSEVVAIENAAFEAALRANPEHLAAFMVRISEQVSDALTLLDDFRGRDVASRLARVLLKFCEQYGVKTDEGVMIDVPVTHQDLANMIGTARETVSRNMARFRRKGIVRDATTGQALEVIDRGSLEALIV